MIKVLLADDFEIIRVLMRYVITTAAEMEVVAIASDGQEAVNKAIIHSPNVAVLDISMPTMDGLEAAMQINLKCPETRVLMVSMHRTSHHIQRSLEAGALGFVLKDDMGYELATAVRTLHQGSRYFSKQVSELAQLYIE